MVVLLAPAPLLDEGVRQVRFGRIRLVTIMEALEEQIGDGTEAVGPFVLPGERRPRAFTPLLPLFGALQDLNPYPYGERMRRQMRSLLANQDARLSGIYFMFDVDPELNGWIALGSGGLKYAEGGITLGDFEATLSDSFQIGTLRTHMPARRLSLIDLRKGGVAIDYRRSITQAAFPGLTGSNGPLYYNYLPTGVGEAVGQGGKLVTGTAVAGIEGSVLRLANRTHGEVVCFEQQEGSLFQNHVIVCDRRGITSPTGFGATAAADADPQTSYGWEEVYGPDYPLTAGDVPTIQNESSRVRYVAAQGAFALDGRGSGPFSEWARVTIHFDNPAGTDFGQATALRSAQVLEWTEERAVVVARMESSNALADVYITLKRGRRPRFEVYGNWASANKPGVQLRMTTIDGGSGGMRVATNAGNLSSDGTIGLGGEAWASYQPITSGDGLGVNIALLQETVTVSSGMWTGPYGVSRRYAAVTRRYAPGAVDEGYVTATLSYTASTSYNSNAEDKAREFFIDAREFPELIRRT